MTVLRVLGTALFLVVFAGLLFLFWFEFDHDELLHRGIPWIEAQREQSVVLAGLLFVLLYTVSTLIFIPSVLMTLAGGFVFGEVFGTFVNLLGATAGAPLCDCKLCRLVSEDPVWYVSRRCRLGNCNRRLSKVA